MDPENENFMSDLSHVMIASQRLGEAAAMANTAMSHFLELFNEDKEKCLLHILEDIDELEREGLLKKMFIGLVVAVLSMEEEDNDYA